MSARLSTWVRKPLDPVASGYLPTSLYATTAFGVDLPIDVKAVRRTTNLAKLAPKIVQLVQHGWPGPARPGTSGVHDRAASLSCSLDGALLAFKADSPVVEVGNLHVTSVATGQHGWAN